MLAIVAIVVALFATCGRNNGSTDTAQNKGEIFLEAASSNGTNPFTPSVAGNPPSATAGPGTATATPKPTPTPPKTSPSGAIAVPASSGSTPGLYGGTNHLSSCDPKQLVTFLQQNPAKATAWVSVLNGDPTLTWSGGNRVQTDQIGQYVAELTPVVLRSDTRVTNHGFADGGATTYQSVLQAGTAVLVDRHGIPRTRCACGNPLTPPKPVPTTPTYTGPPWPGFSPTTVVVVSPPPAVIVIFVLVDVTTGQGIGRPAGTTGASDQPASLTGPAPAATATPPLAPASLTPPPNVTLGQGDVQVTLLWTSDSDLDLHVVDPSGEEINFDHRTSASGGTLDHDEIPGCGAPSATHVENTFWPPGSAPAGTYRASAQNYTSCGTPASYELRITVNGQVVSDTTGTLPAQNRATSDPVTFNR